MSHSLVYILIYFEEKTSRVSEIEEYPKGKRSKPHNSNYLESMARSIRLVHLKLLRHW